MNALSFPLYVSLSVVERNLAESGNGEYFHVIAEKEHDEFCEKNNIRISEA